MERRDFRDNAWDNIILQRQDRLISRAEYHDSARAPSELRPLFAGFLNSPNAATPRPPPAYDQASGGGPRQITGVRG